MIMSTFLDSVDLTAKRLVPLVTYAISGLGRTIAPPVLATLGLVTATLIALATFAPRRLYTAQTTST
jgi:hypothetical protein